MSAVSNSETAVTVPSHVQMLWPTVQALKALGGSASNQEIEDKVTEIAEYTDQQRSVLRGNGPQTEISYRLAWARTYLKMVGAIENSARSLSDI